MRKIELLISQTGEGDIIVQGDLRVKVGGKFVKNTAKEIVKSSLELAFGCEVGTSLNGFGEPFIKIITKSGYEKKFILPENFADFSYKLSKEELNKRMKVVVEYLHKIEEWILNSHKITNNFVIIGE